MTTPLSDAGLDAAELLKDAAARYLSPFGTARLRFLAKRGRADERARAAAPIKLAIQGHDLSPELVELALELVALDEDLTPEDRRALTFLVLAAIAALRQGSTRLPVFADEGRTYVRELLAALAGGAEEAEKVLAQLSVLLDEEHLARSRLIGRREDYKPLVLDGPHLYLQRMLREEERFVSTLAARAKNAKGAKSANAGASADSTAELAAALDDVRRRRSIELSPEQLTAVERAVTAPFTVISGGPGTGKTSIVVAILRVLARLGLGAESIALAAPTGKAANRIAESVRRGLQKIEDPSELDRRLLTHAPDAQTLHRLLGYTPSGDRFVHHENNRLSERVVIVDESSMIDLVLMERLMRSVRDDARLILLGDAEQLPSVDAGAVLRDIVRESAFSVTLAKSFRMDPNDPAGRNILSAARKIRDGAAATLFAAPEPIVVRANVRDIAFSKVELAGGGDRAEARRELLDRWYLEWIESHPEHDRLTRKVYHLEDGAFGERESRELASLFSCFESSRILCITKSATMPTGAEAVNAALHAKAMHSARFIAGKPPSGPFLAGEPVMVQRNDYERRLFNGDQGVVLMVREGSAEPALAAIFAGETGYVAHPLDALGEEIALAYAMTVHKAQGSEFDRVMVVLPERDVPILTRELLYTALTRARRSVVITGDRRMLERGVERRIRRFSGITEKLAASIDSA